jgi:hypothetical protein
VNENSSLVQDIEEQLKRQRLKRQQETESATQNDDDASVMSSHPKQVLGKYRYDKERQAYFPVESNPSVTKPILSKTLTNGSNEAKTTLCASSKRWSRYLPDAGSRDKAVVRVPTLLHAYQSCSDVSIRTHIQSLCMGHCLRDGMEIVPNISCSVDDHNEERWFSWFDHFEAPQQLQQTTEEPAGSETNNVSRRQHNDVSAFCSTPPLLPRCLTVKTLLHPAARTFDLVEDVTPTPTHLLPAFATISPTGLLYTPPQRAELFEADQIGVGGSAMPELEHPRDWYVSRSPLKTV